MMNIMIIMMTSLTTRTGRGRWTGAQWLVLQPALIQVIIIHISMGLKSMVSTVAQVCIFFKSVLFLGAAIAGSINPVKFYYDIGETRHTFSYFHVEKTPKMFCTGDTVSYTCNVGYLLQGSAVLKCRKGGRSICFLNCSPERHLAFKYLKP